MPCHAWQVIAAVIGKASSGVCDETEGFILAASQIYVHFVWVLHCERMPVIGFISSIVEVNSNIIAFMDGDRCQRKDCNRYSKFFLVCIQLLSKDVIFILGISRCSNLQN
jgi:hypothetical protein